MHHLPRVLLTCLFLALALYGCLPAAAIPAPTSTPAPISATAVAPQPSTPALTATAMAEPTLPPTPIPSPTVDPGIITPANAAALVELRQLGLGSQTGAPLYTPDGRWLLLPTATGIYRYDTSSYQSPERIISVPAQEPVDLSRDGKALAIGRRVFDLSGGEVREVTGAEPQLPVQFKDKGPAIAARFSPDGQALGLTYYDPQTNLFQVCIFARSDGRLLYILDGKSFNFSPDGRYLVIQETRKDVQHVNLYEAATGKLLRDWTADRARFIAADRLAVETGGAVRIYDLPDLHVAQSLDGRFASFSPDGQLAAVIVMKELRLLRAADRTVLARMKLDQQSIDDASLTFSPDGQTLAAVTIDTVCCGGYDARETLYHVPDGQVIFQSGGSQAIFSPDGQAIALYSQPDQVQIRSTKEGAVITSLSDLNGAVTQLAFAGGTSELIAATFGSGASKLLFYQPESGRLLKEQPTGMSGYDFGLATSPDGRLMSLAGEIREIAIGQVLDGVTRKMVDHSHTAAIGLAFSPDSTQVAVGQLNGHMEVWDIPSESLVMEENVCGQYDIVSGLAFSPDGQRLAISCTDVMGTSQPNVQLWQAVPHGKHLADLEAQRGGFSHVTYSRDGRVLAAAGSAASAWDAASGALLLTLPPKEDASQNVAQSLALTPDGQLLAIGYTDGTVDLWSVADGQKLRALLGGSYNPVRGLAFSPDGRLLVVGLDDGSIRVWGIK